MKRALLWLGLARCLAGVRAGPPAISGIQQHVRVVAKDGKYTMSRSNGGSIHSRTNRDPLD